MEPQQNWRVGVEGKKIFHFSVLHPMEQTRQTQLHTTVFKDAARSVW